MAAAPDFHSSRLGQQKSGPVTSRLRHGQRVITTDASTPTGERSAQCKSCGAFSIEERDVFGQDAVYCPTCTDRADLLPAS